MVFHRLIHRILSKGKMMHPNFEIVHFPRTFSFLLHIMHVSILAKANHHHEKPRCPNTFYPWHHAHNCKNEIRSGFNSFVRLIVSHSFLPFFDVGRPKIKMVRNRCKTNFARFFCLLFSHSRKVEHD